MPELSVRYHFPTSRSRDNQETRGKYIEVKTTDGIKIAGKNALQRLLLFLFLLKRLIFRQDLV